MHVYMHTHTMCGYSYTCNADILCYMYEHIYGVYGGIIHVFL